MMPGFSSMPVPDLRLLGDLTARTAEHAWPLRTGRTSDACVEPRIRSADEHDQTETQGSTLGVALQRFGRSSDALVEFAAAGDRRRPATRYGRVSTVDHDVLAVDETRTVARQIEGRSRDIFRQAGSRDRLER